MASNQRYVAPVIEKSYSATPIITKDPKEILKSGTFHHVPMMIGYNSNEGGVFEFFRRISPQHVKLDYSHRFHIPYELNLKKDSQQFEELFFKLGNFYNHNATSMVI